MKKDDNQKIIYTRNPGAKQAPKPKFKKKIGGTIKYGEPINKVGMTPEEYNMTYDFVSTIGRRGDSGKTIDYQAIFDRGCEKNTIDTSKLTDEEYAKAIERFAKERSE